ncbi:MAG: tRNA pseudouridine(38-40) synthase TruA, partial [Planctomycetes bacterium]|nr:tRNA pseudouridine(38-40) synthase TruA [Planctomycetota bacterium]
MVAYDGASFAGWQRQRDVVAVQEILEVALEEATGLPVTVSGAGRTDAGVHAEGQVAAFDSRTALPAQALKHLCDHLLPDDVRVLRVDDAAPGFDPQRECVGKLYRYLIRLGSDPSPAWRHTAWRVAGPLDVAAMRLAAAHLVGTHDFRAFRSDPGPERRAESTVRTVTRLDVDEAFGLVRIEAEGPGFLYMMVRNLSASLVEVGSRRRPPSWAGEVLAARD